MSTGKVSLMERRASRRLSDNLLRNPEFSKQTKVSFVESKNFQTENYVSTEAGHNQKILGLTRKLSLNKKEAGRKTR